MRRPALAVFLLALILAVPAAARDIVLESFDAEVMVFTDGSLLVTETIRPRFIGSWNGLIRSIPVEYRTPQGFNYSLFLTMEKITDASGQPLRWEKSRARHYQEFKIWVPGAQDATRTIVLRYRVGSALRFFEEHDELYWNVTGDEWEMPIEAASARILLPAGASGLRALAFTGSYGSQEQLAEVKTEGNTVEVNMRRRLAFREGLTVVVGWNKGVVEEPSALAKGGLFLRMNWPLFFPMGVFGAMFWLWYTRGRDPRLRPIVAQFEPPAGLSPGELGTLMDNSADIRDITATVVDMAVRGYILIEETKEEKLLGLMTDRDYLFRLRKPYEDDKDLKPHERQLLKALFLGRQSSHVQGVLATVALSDLQNRFYKDLPQLRDSLFEELMKRGFYDRRPDKVKRTYMVAGGVVAALTIWGGGAVAGILGLAPATFFVAALLSAALIAGFGWYMPARTVMGARVLEGVLGFEEFLSRVEADRLERMVKTPQMFEKFLPYAMALGVESNWVRAFEDIYRQPPEWYRGTDMRSFHPRSFVSDLGRMSTRAASVMTSAPRSTGSGGWGGGSGFGGGGFSGGGFGGGGGRGF